MPQVQQEWAAVVQNPLIAREQDYDTEQQTQLAEQRIPLLNHDKRSAFDLIMQAVEAKSGQCFFLHGPGGTGKTFVYNTLCPSLRAKVKIVICVASSGIASLLLKGGRTVHSTFKVPLDIHESSSSISGRTLTWLSLFVVLISLSGMKLPCSTAISMRLSIGPFRISVIQMLFLVVFQLSLGVTFSRFCQLLRRVPELR